MRDKNQIKVIKGDITTLEVDAIVNAANSTLLGGGGVDGAIHRAGGVSILEECKQIVAKIGSCKSGEAVITNAGNLKARFVIHTVGPIWHGGKNEEESKLAKAYSNSLKLAVKSNCKTLAFPNISTGVYGFPKDRAAEISIATIDEFLKENKSELEIVLVCFDEENYNLVKSKLEKLE